MKSTVSFPKPLRCFLPLWSWAPIFTSTLFCLWLGRTIGGVAVVPVLLLSYLFLGLYYNFSIWYKLADKTIYGAYIAFGVYSLPLLLVGCLSRLQVWWVLPGHRLPAFYSWPLVGIRWGKNIFQLRIRSKIWLSTAYWLPSFSFCLGGKTIFW